MQSSVSYPSAVKEETTDNEQEKQEEKGISERENHELETVSIVASILLLIIIF